MPKNALASAPLCVLHEYDGSMQAELFLGTPLWTVRPKATTRENQTQQLLVVGSQLEAVCRRVQLLNVKGDTGQGTGVLQQEGDLFKRLETVVGQHTERDMKTFITSDPLGQLYPRLLSRLGVGPIPAVDKRTPFEAHIHHLARINQILVLALQLRTDIQCLDNHKYIAHQLALLYSNLANASPYLDSFRQEIERQFSVVKASSRSADGAPKLPREIRDWLHALISRLLQEIAELPDGLVAPIEPVLACLD